MSLSDYTHTLTQAVSELSDNRSYEGLFHQYKDGDPLPSGKSLRRIVELAREILFPGYFGNSTVHRRTINYHIGVNVEELFSLLTEQIQAGLCFGLENNPSEDTIKKNSRPRYSSLYRSSFHQQTSRNKTYSRYRCRSGVLRRSGSHLLWRNHLLLSYYSCNYQLPHSS